MQSGKRTSSHAPTRSAAVGEVTIWFDQTQALIVERTPGLEQSVEIVDREPGETDAQFEVRAIDEIPDEDRVVVSGPADARLELERTYVALTHRPDRLVDVEPRTPTSRS